MFDAIDAGNWASAQAGIATLPRGLLTPVAKAELYTAKGSPVVDLASLQALVAEAPELPAGGPAFRHGNQARRAHATADHSGKADLQSGLSSDPLQSQGGAGRALCRSASCPPRSADQGERLRGRRSATADLRAAIVDRSPCRSGPARRLRLLCQRTGSGRPPRRGHLAPGRDRRMGEPGGLDFGPRLLAARRLERRFALVPASRATGPAARAPRRRLLLGRAGRTGSRTSPFG